MSSNYFEEDSEFADYYEDLETTMDTLPPPPPPPPEDNHGHRQSHAAAPSRVREDDNYHSSSYKSEGPARRNGLLEIDSSNHNHYDQNYSNDQSPVSNNRGTQAERKSPSSGDRSGPFPFLRRGSRKEPSALNRSPTKPSPEKDDSSSSNQQRSAARPMSATRSSTTSNPFEVKVANPPAKADNYSKPSANTATFNRTQPPPQQPSKKAPKHDEDVLLQGSDYWGLDNSIVQDLHEIQHKKPTQQLPSNDYDYDYAYNHNDDDDEDDHLASTTMTYGTEDNRMRQAKVAEDLEEFQKLERTMGGHNHTNKHTFHADEYDLDYGMQDDNASVYTATTYANTVTLEEEREKMRGRELSNSSSFNPAHRPTALNSNNHNATYGRPVDESKLHKSSMSWGAATQPPTAQSTDNHNHNNSNMAKRGYAAQTSAAFAPQREEPQSQATQRSQVRASNNQFDNASHDSQEGSGKVIRPVSTLKKDVRSTTPSNANRGKASSKDANNSNNRASSQADDLQKSLEQKAKELETELETYKSENANLKKLRKQQEQSLAEIVQKKEEMIRHCEEEKYKVTHWCEEQKQLIEKEKRAAAKQIRDMKQKAATGPSMPIRKEKAEMEALQATIEKMKVSQDSAAKKAKLNENRLYGLIKEHSTHIENLEKQLLALEEQKILLLDFIAESGQRLPKNIRMKLQSISAEHPATAASPVKNNKASSNAALQSRSTRISGDRGYAEEVDVEVIPAYSNYHYFDKQQAMANAAKIVTEDYDGEDGYDSRDSYPQQSATGRQSAQRQPAPAQRPSSASGQRPTPASSSAAPTTITSNISEAVRNSWARSSRSSGRYSSEEHDDNESQDPFDDYYQDDHQQTQPAEPPRNLGTTSNDGIAYNPRGDGTPKHRLSSSFQQPEQPSLRSSVDTASYSNNKPMSQIKTAIQEVRSSSSIPNSSSNKAQSPHTSSATTTQDTAASSSSSTANRVEEIRPDGSRIIRYRNGTVKEVDAKGVVSKVRFTNDDVKTTYAETGTVVYYYAQADTTHTSYKDGTEIYKFPNGQSEKHNTDGSKEVLFPDNTRKLIYPDGIQETTFPDGVILREYPDGRREIIS